MKGRRKVCDRLEGRQIARTRGAIQYERRHDQAPVRCVPPARCVHHASPRTSTPVVNISGCRKKYRWKITHWATIHPISAAPASSEAGYARPARVASATAATVIGTATTISRKIPGHVQDANGVPCNHSGSIPIELSAINPIPPYQAPTAAKACTPTSTHRTTRTDPGTATAVFDDIATTSRPTIRGPGALR